MPIETTYRALSRLRESGSWAAIAAALGTLGTQVPEPWRYWCFVGAAIASVVGVLLKDPGSKS